MSRNGYLEDRGPAWRGLLLGAASAGGVLLLLAASVGLVWLVGRSPEGAPAVGVQPPPTPTPRALSLVRETPAPSDADGQPSLATEIPPGESLPAESAPATPPASLLVAGGDAQSGAPGNGAFFSAPDDRAFSELVAGSWEASADALRNNGASAAAEPLLPLADVPGAAFAIEAEIRVNEVLDAFCGQSFGLAGGDPSLGLVYGGGVRFPCDDETAQASLTDVSVWEDGYHADPLIAENAFEPGEDWRTYRFELRGDTVRLIVDGVGIVSGELETPLTDAASAKAALWSQGVDLEIRRIEIFPLPES